MKSLSNDRANDPKLDLVGLCCRILDDKNAREIHILDVGEISSITDYLIIATCTSEPHLRAVSKALENGLRKEKHPIISHDSDTGSGWTVLDAHDVIVHLFVEEIRDLYRLDDLWKDGTKVPPSLFIEETAPTGEQRSH